LDFPTAPVVIVPLLFLVLGSLVFVNSEVTIVISRVVVVPLLFLVVGTLVFVTGDVSVVLSRILSPFFALSFPAVVESLLVRACVLGRIGHLADVISRGDFRPFAFWRSLFHNQLTVLLHGGRITFVILDRQFIDEFQEDFKGDMFGLVAAKLLESYIAVCGGAGLVVKPAILGHFGPILVVEFLDFGTALSLVGEVHERAFQLFVGRHLSVPIKEKGMK